MNLDPADVVVLVALIVAGPWGLVLALALARGYSITVTLTRRDRGSGG